MKIDLRFAELHAPLFMTDGTIVGKGRNLGVKLGSQKLSGNHSELVMYYDTDNQLLHVHLEGMESIIPATNIVSMMAASPKVEQIAQPDLARSPYPPQKVTAQVETPTGHVFAGPGKGLTGQEKRGKAIL